MKTAITCFVSLMVFATIVCAQGRQGTFIMSNYEPSDGLDAPIYDADGNRLGTNYLALLYGGPTVDSLQPVLPPAPFSPYPQFGRGPGYFWDDFRAVTNVVPGLYAWLQIVAWDRRLGSTYQEVVNLGIGGYGQSPLFYAKSGGDGVQPSQPRALLGLQSFNLLPVVPEPSVIGLFLSGALVCWRFARKPRSEP